MLNIQTASNSLTHPDSAQLKSNMGAERSKIIHENERDNLKRLMKKYPSVVAEYYQSNQTLAENYITETYWEEDVERWLDKIRARSPKENLQVRKVDFLREKNGAAHNTGEYENDALVIRRASTFDLDVYFGNRCYDNSKDDLALVLSLGPKSSEAAGTKFVCKAESELKDKSKWSCQFLCEDKVQKKVSLRVNVPVNSIVARYSVYVDVTSGTQKGRVKTQHKAGEVIVIFNPFCKDDSVYMEDDAMRKEYVLNDEGFVNAGYVNRYARRIKKINWDFAQFDEGILDAVLKMLQNDVRSLARPEKTLKKRNSPVYVSRILTAMVNCSDDKGIIWGRWDGKYDDGKSPGAWNGSAEIINQWYKNDMKPVKYGQCWVFSAVLTTALRAIGIPARSVTNFSSAHDTDGNQTIDIYYDSQGEKMDDTSDSVWNFHVWNEAFFCRPDLPKGYDGWQAVDATPQESSALSVATPGMKSLMQCGPAPLKAIKEGAIDIGYDTPFIFSEVNADQVIWTVNEDNAITTKPRVFTRAVGLYIATKAVGSMETENLVNNYKYKEGTPEERKAFARAYGLGTRDHSTLNITADQSHLVAPAFEVTIDDINDVKMGSNFTATIKIKNLTTKERKANLKLVCRSMRHTGTLHGLVKRERKELNLPSKKVVEVKFSVLYEEYANCLVDNKMLNVVAMVTDAQDGNTVMDNEYLAITPPECISVELPTDIKWYDKSEFTVKFKNNFSMKLTDCKFQVTIKDDVKEVIVHDPIAPGEMYTLEKIEFTPEFGWRCLYPFIEFTSNEKKDITKSCRIRVKY